LHAIRWAATVWHRSTTRKRAPSWIETIALPLTTPPRLTADLWVDDYQHDAVRPCAKHAWCRHPAPSVGTRRARSFEPLVAGHWRTREMAAMGHEPFRSMPPVSTTSAMRFMLELPAGGLMSRRFGDGGQSGGRRSDKADLAIGDFSKIRVQISN
jgi:hypothetical protein